jgi:hypothetical protein
MNSNGVLKFLSEYHPTNVCPSFSGFSGASILVLYFCVIGAISLPPLH